MHSTGMRVAKARGNHSTMIQITFRLDPGMLDRADALIDPVARDTGCESDRRKVRRYAMALGIKALERRRHLGLKAAPPEEPEKPYANIQTTIRVDPTMVARADALVDHFARSTGLDYDRARALRYAVALGIEELERRHPVETKGPSGRKSKTGRTPHGNAHLNVRLDAAMMERAEELVDYVAWDTGDADRMKVLRLAMALGVQELERRRSEDPEAGGTD